MINIKDYFFINNLLTEPLNLDSNQVGDVGAEALAKLTGLTTLKVVGNQIGDAGKRELQKLSNLGIRVSYDL
ncbi:MAG: hypothetical protein IBJ00_06895 [Alphaproteobacteria bacterium]|nr:hypothetical protein [Alphaproteobacteria bacterium]